MLSSQANIAGYKAVLLSAAAYGRMMPILMTAAGTIKAARVLILGAGVAGLQAIATAKRMGAVIEASDVRPAVKEQIESLGAKFVDVPYETDEEREIAKCVGGYARPMPESWMKRQSAAVAEKMKPADSSALYARNVLDFLKLVIDKEGRLAINLEDDIVKACLMTQDGQLLRS